MAQSACIQRANSTAFVIVAAALLVILFAATSQAEKKAGPCAEDVEKFCKDVQRGGGRMAKCLSEHEEDLSTGCKERIEAVKQERQEFREACEDDVLNFCKDIKPGGRRIINCLKEHKNELTSDCKEMMEKKKGAK